MNLGICLDLSQHWHVLLGVAFVIIPILILIITAEDEVGCLTYLITLVLLIAAIVFLGSTAWDNYDAAFVEQPEMVESESYELVAASYDSDIYGTLSTKYYRRLEGELREDDLFKFYYLADGERGEMKLMTLNASEVSLYFVEEGGKPCWKIITTTKIRVNSKTGKVEEEVLVRNELYVPSESVTPSYDLDVVD